MSLLFAVLGIGLGLWFASSSIIFDGVYSLISLGLSLLSLIAGRYVRIVDEAKFPFGKSLIQPITLVFKSLTLFVLCTLSILDGVRTLLAGGRELDFGHAAAYSGAASLASLFIFRFLGNRAKKEHSDLLRAECHEWLLDTVLSFMLTLGFAVALLLVGLGFDRAAGWVDPVMLIFAAGYFLRIPLGILIQSSREIVGLRVKNSLEDEIRLVVEEIVKAWSFETYYLRIQKVGSTIYLEIDFIVADKDSTLTIAEQDRIRLRLWEHYHLHPYVWWVTVSFTADERWAR